MRVRGWFLALAPLVALTACSSDYAPASPAPTAVSCTDGPQLRERALDDRRRSDEASSSQAKISIGTRASFFASLAIIADLKCRATVAEADEALKPALEAARKAEHAGNFYGTASAWGEADFIATEVIALLVQQLPVPSR